MTDNTSFDTKPEFGRLETTALALVTTAIPLLLFPAARDYALTVIDVAALLAFLAFLYGLAAARSSLLRRAGVLCLCLAALYLAHSIAAPYKDGSPDLVPALVRWAFE
jgi:hypothetical protein